jgi:hypothetical protein
MSSVGKYKSMLIASAVLGMAVLVAAATAQPDVRGPDSWDRA